RRARGPGGGGDPAAAVRVHRPGSFLNRPWLTVIAAHVAHVQPWYEFVKNYIRLFDGVTIYHYFVDPQLISRPSDIGFAVLFLVVGCGMRLALRVRRTADV